MARAPFCIVERTTAAERVYMARFYDTEGKIVKTKTFPGAKSPAAVARKAEALLREGVMANAANPDALEYLRGFWTRESDYVFPVRLSFHSLPSGPSTPRQLPFPIGAL
ncbi:MAG TPA: hypothetical protein VMV90_15020 [Rectinemataceae bacterium]|nr:hypothetical protein [Rectinemataceae bacterium]